MERIVLSNVRRGDHVDFSCIDDDATGCGSLIPTSSYCAVSSADTVDMDDLDVCNATYNDN